MRTTLVVLGVLAAMVVGFVGCRPGEGWQWRRAASHLRLPGTVESQEVRLASKSAGRVAEVQVREGEWVDPGAPLVAFETPELLAERSLWQAELRAAQAKLELARKGPREEERRTAAAQLALAQARRDLVVQGPRQEDIEAARGELASVQAERHQAELDWRRAQMLLKDNAISRAEHDAAQSLLDRTRAHERTAQARLIELERGSRVEEIAEAEAELHRAEAQRDLVEAGSRPEEIAAAEAAVAEIQARLDRNQVDIDEGLVKAPSRGLIEVVAIRKGDMVSPGHPVVRLLRPEDLWVKAFVPETELGRVRQGQEVTVTIDSYPGEEFTGTIDHIASVSEFTPRNVQSSDERRHQVFAIKVRVQDEEGVFKAGMAAEVHVPLAPAKQAP